MEAVIVRLGLALILLAGIGCGQEFEVATVRPSPPPDGPYININLGTVRNGKVTFGNASLSDCLKFAYGVASNDQIAGPDWIKSKDVRFDIVAQAGADATQDQLRAMMQKLLQERLKVELHHEARALSYLALVAGKNGSTMRQVDAAAAAGAGGNTALNGLINGNRMAMSGLALLLSRFTGQTILDMTELAGLYEVRLKWTPDVGPPLVLNGAVVEGPSLVTAVQEQLGLRLESRKGPVDVLVVDRAEKTPGEN